MKRNWMAIIVLAGGSAVAFGQQYPPQQYPQQQYPPQQYPQQQYPQQQYPQQNGPYQGDPNYAGQNGNGQYGDPGYADNGDPNYNQEGVNAPAPPMIPSYAYDRPPEPGPGYSWVDGYWNWAGRRYVWVGGYWMRPPYAGAYWVGPRYSSGRFFAGFWGRPHYDRGFVRRDYAYRQRFEAPRNSYRPRVEGRREFRGGESHGYRSGDRERHEHRR